MIEAEFLKTTTVVERYHNRCKNPHYSPWSLSFLPHISAEKRENTFLKSHMPIYTCCGSVAVVYLHIGGSQKKLGVPALLPCKNLTRCWCKKSTYGQITVEIFDHSSVIQYILIYFYWFKAFHIFHFDKQSCWNEMLGIIFKRIACREIVVFFSVI